MSKLDELIKELCPNGVEYVKLKDCAEMKRGTSATKKTLKVGEIPVVSGGKEPSFYCDISNRTGETITVAGSGAGAGYVQYWNEPIFVNDAFSLKGNSNTNTRYLYHCLLSLQDKIYSTKKGGGVPHVHISSIDTFKLPLPPLPVQSEIVRILDNFTELTAELTAELVLRKKQYEYYRDRLLSFNSCSQFVHVERERERERERDGKISQNWSELHKKVVWVKLGEIGKISSGGDVPKNRYSKEKTENYTVPIYSNGVGENALYGFTDKPKITEKCVTISARGTIGYTSLHKEPFVPIIRLICIIPNDEISVSYLKYAVETLDIQVPKTGIPQLTVPMISNYSIPLPPLSEQQRIVDILDRFDTLTNDISTGLPSEIDARQKQYEYYREKLLTFKELKNNEV